MHVVLLQAVAIIVLIRTDLPHGQEYISRSLGLDWSFGMCFTDNLTALQRLSLAYFTPLYLLTLIAVAFFFSRFPRLVHIFGRSTVIRMFWQFILLSYSSVAINSFLLLKCVPLEPRQAAEGAGLATSRFADDPHLECFRGEHLPWAIVAVLLIATFSIPLPLLMPFLHSQPRFTPFADVFSSHFDDKRRWWSSVDLLRRLVLAAIHSFVGDPADEYLAMVLICIFLLAIQGLAWPFKSRQGNVVETGLLLALCCITVLSAPDTTWIRAVAVQCVFFSAVGVMLIIWLIHRGKKTAAGKPDSLAKWRQSARRHKQHLLKLRGGQRLAEVDDGCALRDSLLADEFPGMGDESTSRIGKSRM